MPQMSPMWWMTLLLTFMMMYLMIMMTIYSFKIYNKKSKNIKILKSKKFLNWKW
nr:ATPase subunit 8 [Deraeocoris sp.]